MMKSFTLTLTLLLSFLSYQLFAQSFTFESDETHQEFVLDVGNNDQDVVSHGFVTNLNPFSNNLYWERTEIHMPDGWESAICDKIACYFPSVGEKALNMDASEESILDLHVYTHGVGSACDSSVIEVCVYEVNNPSSAVCKTYVTKVECLVSAQDVDNAEVTIQISPNPATDYFTVDADENVGRVEIYNIIGAKLKSFESRNHAAFPVGELPSGMYLVRVYNETNSRVLSTLRLKKR